jgi:hypothetical protein
MAPRDPNPHRRKTAARTAASVIAVIAACLLTAGCGGSSPRTTSGSNTAAKQVAFSRCMRTHGVPDFPDPGASSGVENSIGGIAIPTTINMQSPAFKTAQANCVKLLPSGPPVGKQQLTALERQMVQTSRCMRAQGVTGFPDPTNGPVPAGSAGNSIGMGGHVVSLVLPSTINVNSPAFKQAAAKCHFA